MKPSFCFLLYCAIVHATTTAGSPDNADGTLETTSTTEKSGNSLEMVLGKLEYIDRKLSQLQSELHQYRDQMVIIQAAHENTFVSVQESINSLADQLYPPFTSCKDVPSKMSGIYHISPNNETEPFKVFCEQMKYGGGWIVIQHRFDGSVDFNQNWAEYRDGFGNLDNEFWLGLEKVHQITTTRAHEIIFEIKDFKGNYGYARYDAFKIGSESNQYSLQILGKYSGTAGDSMGSSESSGSSKGMKFSTKDRDNDLNSGQCAHHWESAWWFRNCAWADLNGLYKNVDDWKSINWYHFKNDKRGMSFTRIMIREM
uniref:Putative ficolin n=1 Tax=Anopheles triannulatus TaxID=58253 RepID=A0A2M4AXH1_9DIPT